jgi:hypothetical protein
MSYAALIDAWYPIIAASRERQVLPPLVDRTIALGQERLRDEVDYPRIVIVPEGLSAFRSELPAPPAPTGTISDASPRVLWTARASMTAHFWGADFDDVLELHRELCVAIYRTYSGALERAVSLGDLTYVQDTDHVRRGRWASWSLSLVWRIDDEPWTALRYGEHPDVEIDLTMRGPSEPAGSLTIPE